MAILSSETLHATTVSIGGRGVLIEGVSGAGKSDLALRLIDRGATLVSDDYSFLQRRDGRLFARQAHARQAQQLGVGRAEGAAETVVVVASHEARI